MHELESEKFCALVDNLGLRHKIFYCLLKLNTYDPKSGIYS